jgi:phospholipase/carboxylesterase
VRHVERPSAGDAVGALVFFHGVWGVPDDFLPFMDKLDPARRFHAYLPQGPHPMSEGRFSWDEQKSGVLAPEVATWLHALPFDASRMVLGGWSQGTWAAYTLALEPGRPRPAGVIALGGWLPSGVDLEAPLPRFAIAHGTADESVDVEHARRARDVLQAAGADVLYRETAVGHEIDQAVLPDLRGFLQSLL